MRLCVCFCLCARRLRYCGRDGAARCARKIIFNGGLEGFLSRKECFVFPVFISGYKVSDYNLKEERNRLPLINGVMIVLA